MKETLNKIIELNNFLINSEVVKSSSVSKLRVIRIFDYENQYPLRTKNEDLDNVTFDRLINIFEEFFNQKYEEEKCFSIVFKSESSSIQIYRYDDGILSNYLMEIRNKDKEIRIIKESSLSYDEVEKLLYLFFISQLKDLSNSGIERIESTFRNFEGITLVNKNL